jgi:hypothetical protein
MTFATRKRRVVFADKRVVTFGHFHDKFIVTGQFCRSNDFVIGCAVFPEADIVRNGIVKQHRILKLKTHIPHKGFGINAAQVLIADFYTAPPHVPKSCNEPGYVLLPFPDGPASAVML